MEQITSLWAGLDARRRVIVALAGLAMFAAVLGLTRMAAEPPMALLYAGLDTRASGEVVKSLDQHAVTYKVRGDAIYVPAAERDQLRMTLASEGLPATGGAGYELLDNLSGFGTTSQMFDAAYWRAKEGELARSIVSSPMIRTARVYISPARDQPFRQGAKPTASVMVTTRGGQLPPEQAKALKYLVASAVAGLQPEDVAIIDAANGLVMERDTPGSSRAAGDLAARLTQNVKAILDARVGPGKSVVAVNVDPVTEQEHIVEKTFDPSGRVAISTDNQSNSSTSSGKGGAPVTVASNLPNGDANASGSTSQSQDNSTRELTNYEVSSTERQLTRGPGTVRRLTVAVLVDGETVQNAQGAEVWQPRSEEEMKTLRDLVASAVGFDEKRGDVITVKSLAFQPVAPLGTAATGTSFLAGIDLMSVIQIALLALVALALGLFVVRPVLLSSGGGAGLPALAPPGDEDEEDDGLPQMNMALPQVLTGEIDDGGGGFFPGGMDFVTADGAGGGGGGDPVARLRNLIEERQEETLEILKSWVEDRKETES